MKMPRKHNLPLSLRFWSKVDVTCPDKWWIWTGGKLKTGYGQLSVTGRGPIKAHRLAYELAFGPIPPGDGYHGTVIMHSCDVPLCCNPAHLSAGTQADNLQDMARKGRRNGEKSPLAKITEAQALMIKRSRRSARSIALEMGISPRAAQRIRAGDRWSHL